MTHNWWWVINDESPDDPCIWSRGNLYPFFWCKWYLVSSFQICVGGSNFRWRHDDVIINHKVSFITWFLWCLFRVTFWIKQAFTKQWSEHHFSVPYHVTQWVTWWKHVMMTSSSVFVTWLWGHMIFRFILFWNVQIGRNSLVTSAYTCGGLYIRVQHFFWMCCSLIWNPLYFCASEFRSKAIWPTADNRLKLLNESAPSGGNHICAILSSPSESLDSATKWPN